MPDETALHIDDEVLGLAYRPAAGARGAAIDGACCALEVARIDEELAALAHYAVQGCVELGGAGEGFLAGEDRE